MNTNSEYHPVDELLQDSMASDVPADVRTRLGRRLTAFGRQLASADAARSRHAFLPRWAKAVPVAAALVLLAVAVAHWFGPSGVALADVLDHVRTARVISFDESVELSNGMSVTAQVLAHESGRCRITMPEQGMVMIMDPLQGKALSLVPAQKVAVSVSTPPPGVDQLPGGDQSAAGFIDSLRKLREGAEEHLGRRDINGQSAVGFRVAQGPFVWEIWAHHETGFPVRVEFEMRRMGHGVMENFRFDPDADESLFSLTPPDGYTLQEMKMDSSVATEQDLVTGLRFVTRVSGGRFPSAFAAEDIQTIMAERPADRPSAAPKEPDLQEVASFSRAFIFVAQLNPENDWHYAGEGAMLGDAERPVCWWRPDGADSYRVIYGDLSIRDVPADELPAR